MQTFWVFFGRNSSGVYYHMLTTDSPLVYESMMKDPMAVECRTVQLPIQEPQ